jgi:phosphatidylinositol 4-kinase
LPFVSSSMRNFAILHIVADESRIFRTKERAPVMLCFEVYRPIELSLEKKSAFVDM